MTLGLLTARSRSADCLIARRRRWTRQQEANSTLIILRAATSAQRVRIERRRRHTFLISNSAAASGHKEGRRGFGHVASLSPVRCWQRPQVPARVLKPVLVGANLCAFAKIRDGEYEFQQFVIPDSYLVTHGRPAKVRLTAPGRAAKYVSHAKCHRCVLLGILFEFAGVMQEALVYTKEASRVQITKEQTVTDQTAWKRLVVSQLSS